jgi:hypothetical protein
LVPLELLTDQCWMDDADSNLATWLALDATGDVGSAAQPTAAKRVRVVAARIPILNRSFQLSVVRID